MGTTTAGTDSCATNDIARVDLPAPGAPVIPIIWRPPRRCSSRATRSLTLSPRGSAGTPVLMSARLRCEIRSGGQQRYEGRPGIHDFQHPRGPQIALALRPFVRGHKLQVANRGNSG